MTDLYRVVANYWKANEGWTHEEEVDQFPYRISAEVYVNSLDDDTLEGYFSGGHDAVQFDVLDDDGNKTSDYWVDRDSVIAANDPIQLDGRKVRIVFEDGKTEDIFGEITFAEEDRIHIVREN